MNLGRGFVLDGRWAFESLKNGIPVEPNGGTDADHGNFPSVDHKLNFASAKLETASGFPLCDKLVNDGFRLSLWV